MSGKLPFNDIYVKPEICLSIGMTFNFPCDTLVECEEWIKQFGKLFECDIHRPFNDGDNYFVTIHKMKPKEKPNECIT